MNRTTLLLAAGFVFAAGLTFGRQLPRRGAGDHDVAPGTFMLVSFPDPTTPTTRSSRTLVISGVACGADSGPPGPGGWALTFNPGTPHQRTYLAAPRNLDAE